MGSTWGFKWVQVVLHNQKSLFTLCALISVSVLAGLGQVSWGETTIWSSVGIALLLMSAVTIKLMDSFKTALFIFGFSLYSLLMLLGLMGWSGLPFSDESLLGLVIVIVMMMSNLIHVLSGCHRDMARGAHQFDAIGESLSANMSPILLSNITTLLGFVIVAYTNPGYTDLAYLVIFGFAITLFSLLTWYPLIMLNWLLEFRVGNYEDRHGLITIANWMKKHAMLTGAIKIVGLMVSVLAIYVLFSAYSNVESIALMLVGCLILLVWAWRSIKLALMLVSVCFVALAWTYLLLYPVVNLITISPLVLLVPLGIILDDGIHLFSRLYRAERFYQYSGEDKIRFVLSSVGRPIWNTSVVLVAGFLTIFLFSVGVVQLTSLITLLGVIAVTLVMLLLLPTFYMENKRL